MTYRIKDHDMNSVLLICTDKEVAGKTRRVPEATAFFISIPDEKDSAQNWYYAVTARYVIQDSSSEDLYLRINMTSGKFEDILTKKEDWYNHDDADVAIIPLESLEDLLISVIPTVSFIHADFRYKGPPLSDEFVQKVGGVPVGVGDEIYYLGMFVQHLGEERNLPVARFGSISRMPKEIITLPRWGGTGSFETEAYLAESHAWAGHTGSPVFWTFPAARKTKTLSGMLAEIGHLSGLLGLVSGHFNNPEGAITQGDSLDKIMTKLNAGMAIITPAEAIRQLLLREDLVSEREERRSTAEENDQPPLTLDAYADSLPSEGVTSEEFEDAFREAFLPDQEDEPSDEE